MTSYGYRLVDLRRRVIEYITEKVEKERAYKLEPGDLFIQNNRCYSKMTAGPEIVSKKLEELSVETLCNIADKIHFRPLGGTVVNVAKKQEIVEQKSENKQKIEDMNFEIKKDIPLPGHVFKNGAEKKAPNKKGKYTNYRSLPLKQLEVGDCIIVHECTEEDINYRYSATRVGVEGLVKLMDTKKKFKVAKTHDLKVGVWRVE